MDCNEVRLNLHRFLDDALDRTQAEAMEAHLNECDDCWQQLGALRGLDLDLSDLGEPAPLPDDFTDRVMQRVHDERPTGVHLVWPWLRQKWSRKQYASVAYAMSATMVVFSAGNLLFLWSETSTLLSTWGIKAQAYLDAGGAYVGVPAEYISELWKGLLTLLHLG